MARVLEMQGFTVCHSLVNRHLLTTSRETIYNDEVDWLSCQREPQDSRRLKTRFTVFGWVTLRCLKLTESLTYVLRLSWFSLKGDLPLPALPESSIWKALQCECTVMLMLHFFMLWQFVCFCAILFSKLSPPVLFCIIWYNLCAPILLTLKQHNTKSSNHPPRHSSAVAKTTTRSQRTGRAPNVKVVEAAQVFQVIALKLLGTAQGCLAKWFTGNRTLAIVLLV